MTTIGKKHITYKSILTLKAISRLIIVSLNIRWLFIAFIHLTVLGVRRKSFFFNYFSNAVFGSSISRTLISPVAVQSGFTSKAHPTLVRSPLKTILVTGGVDSSCAAATENVKKLSAVISPILMITLASLHSYVKPHASACSSRAVGCLDLEIVGSLKSRG